MENALWRRNLCVRVRKECSFKFTINWVDVNRRRGGEGRRRQVNKITSLWTLSWRLSCCGSSNARLRYRVAHSSNHYWHLPIKVLFPLAHIKTMKIPHVAYCFIVHSSPPLVSFPISLAFSLIVIRSEFEILWLINVLLCETSRAVPLDRLKSRRCFNYYLWRGMKKNGFIIV